MKTTSLSLLSTFCLFTLVAHPGARAQEKAIVIDKAWEEVEHVDLPDGTLQIRIKPRVRVLAVARHTETTDSGQAVGAAPESTNQPATDASNKETSVSVASIPRAVSDMFRERLAVDLSVPASPAMAVLGVSGTEIQRPALPRDLAATLIKGFDNDGKSRDAFAVDIVPASLWFRSIIKGGIKYENTPWMRLLARTTFSLGASKVEDTENGNDYGAGIRIGLIDGSDPGLYWHQRDPCLREILQKIPPTSERVENGMSTDAPVPPDVLATCNLDRLVADLWAKPALYVGYAQGWHSNTQSFSDAKGNAKAFWAAFSIGLNPRSQAEVNEGGGNERVKSLLQLYLARKIDEHISNPTGADDFVREDRSEFVARLRFGKVKWHGYIEAGAAHTRTAGLEREAIRRVGFGAEYMLRDDIWLVVGSMRETGFRDGARTVLNTGLRFSQVPKGLFGLPDLNAK